MTWQNWLTKLLGASLIGGALDMVTPASSTQNYLRFLWGVIMLSIFVEPLIQMANYK